MKSSPRLIALAVAAALSLACQPAAEPAATPLVDEAAGTTASTAPTDEPDPADGEANIALTDEEEVTVVNDDTPSPEFIASSDQFARALWATLLEEHEDNALISPASVFLGFLMTEPGASGETLVQTREVLHLSDGDVHQDAAAMIALITNDEGPTIRVANRYWLENAWAGLLLPDFQAVLTDAYGAGVGSAPFATSPEEARTSINAWVSEQTNERIEELLPDGSIDRLVRAVLINTIFFDAAWAAPFDESQTSPAPFATPAGQVEVPMMTRRDNYKVASGDGWTGIEIPYEGGEWSLVAVLPDDGADYDLFDAVNLVTASHQRSVDLFFPKFTYRHAFSVKEPMQRLGLRDAFQVGVADYSRMFAAAQQQELYISRAFHEAVIEFSEEGTEAAAATAIVMSEEGGPPREPEVMRFDRPFEFVIRHQETATVLFVGRVENPLE